MTITQAEAQDILAGMVILQEKVIQAQRVKDKFDERRALLIKRISDSLQQTGVVDPAILEAALVHYSKERAFFDVLGIGIKNLEAFEERVAQLAKQIGISTTILAGIFMRWNKTSVSSISAVKYTYKATLKYSAAIKKIFPQLLTHFNSQHTLLLQLKSMDVSLPDTKLMWEKFITSVSEESANIKNFLKTGMQEKMFQMLSSVSPAHSAILLAWVMKAPGAALVTPIMMPIVGPGLAVVLGLLSEIVKFALAYAFYKYAKNQVAINNNLQDKLVATRMVPDGAKSLDSSKVASPVFATGTIKL